MSEERGEYIVKQQTEIIQWERFLKSGCLKPYSSKKYKAATRNDIATLIDREQWSELDVANMVGVQFDPEKGRGSTTVKNWLRPEGSNAHRKITYAAWRLMLINAGLVDS